MVNVIAPHHGTVAVLSDTRVIDGAIELRLMVSFNRQHQGLQKQKKKESVSMFSLTPHFAASI